MFRKAPGTGRNTGRAAHQAAAIPIDAARKNASQGFVVATKPPPADETRPDPPPGANCAREGKFCPAVALVRHGDRQERTDSPTEIENREGRPAKTLWNGCEPSITRGRWSEEEARSARVSKHALGPVVLGGVVSLRSFGTGSEAFQFGRDKA